MTVRYGVSVVFCVCGSDFLFLFFALLFLFFFSPLHSGLVHLLTPTLAGRQFSPTSQMNTEHFSKENLASNL